MKTLLVTFDSVESQISGGFQNELGGEFDKVTVASNIPADSASQAIATIAGGYSHIVACSSMRSKDVMARVAGILDAAMITDAIAVTTPTEFVRPILAGTVFTKVEVLAEPVVVTFRASAFAQQPIHIVQELALSFESSKTTIASTQIRSGSRPDLTQAKIIVSGGRPLKDSATFEQIIGGLADKLGGAVGATRAAVDSGIAPNELQVGQTGKIVAPDLYIAAGISGSTQHMAGIKDSKCIVAINKDPDAPIFEFADFGLVADLFDAIPEIHSKLSID